MTAMGYPERTNCAVTLLDQTVADLGPNRPCITADDATWTYGELLDSVERCASVLANWGVQSGNRVLLRIPNNAWLAASWLAILRIGAIPVTTMTMMRHLELAKVIDIANVQWAIVDHRFTQEFDDFAVPTLISGGEQADTLQAQAARVRDRVAPCATYATDIALLAFTSGTTGKPKATMHTHADVLAIADTFSAQILKPNADDVFCGTPPLAFTFGLGGLLIFPLRVGASTVLIEQADPAAVLQTIAGHRVSCLFTAPTAYRALLSVLGQAQAAGAMVDISSLRRCVSAGETLPEAIWTHWFTQTGVKLIDGIGATEMLHIFISAADDDIVPGATGRPVPGYEAMVVDDAFKPVPPGELGRLAVRGPTGCRYLDDDRQQIYVQHGWNVTGDIYTCDERGYFRYIARGDDIIVSSGYNIAAPEVEAALLMHDAVAEVAVVGDPDEQRGMIVHAFVVLNDGADAAQMTVTLQEHVKSVIAPYKYPRKLTFVDALPRTATGKLQRFRLRDGLG